MLARAWSAGAGQGNEPLTIDLDSTVCETYGLAKEGAQRHNYAGQRRYHPLLAVAAGTGDVLMARLRKGRANTARGDARFLRETTSRVRCAGATGPLTMRADSGFYNHDIVAVCPRPQVRRGSQPPAIGTLYRQRRLDVCPSYGPQPGPLDHAHRPGRAGDHYQDPQTTLLLPGRTHHPKGPSPHPASPPTLVLEEPVHQRAGKPARPASAFLTTPSASLTQPQN